MKNYIKSIKNSTVNGITQINENNKTLIQNGENIIRIEPNCVIINDKAIEKPKGLKGHNITQINNNIYIDGYELIDNKFKKTFAALLHLIF